MARAGSTYAEIAKELGYCNSGGAWKLVNRALKASEVEDVEDHRALELARLDRLQSALWDEALAGDLRAVREVLKIVQARTRLLGLERPPTHQAGQPLVLSRGAVTGVPAAAEG